MAAFPPPLQVQYSGLVNAHGHNNMIMLLEKAPSKSDFAVHLLLSLWSFTEFIDETLKEIDNEYALSRLSVSQLAYVLETFCRLNDICHRSGIQVKVRVFSLENLKNPGCYGGLFSISLYYQFNMRIGSVSVLREHDLLLDVAARLHVDEKACEMHVDFDVTAYLLNCGVLFRFKLDDAEGDQKKRTSAIKYLTASTVTDGHYVFTTMAKKGVVELQVAQVLSAEPYKYKLLIKYATGGHPDEKFDVSPIMAALELFGISDKFVFERDKHRNNGHSGIVFLSIRRKVPWKMTNAAGLPPSQQRSTYETEKFDVHILVSEDGENLVNTGPLEEFFNTPVHEKFAQTFYSLLSVAKSYTESIGLTYASLSGMTQAQLEKFCLLEQNEYNTKDASGVVCQVYDICDETVEKYLNLLGIRRYKFLRKCGFVETGESGKLCLHYITDEIRQFLDSIEKEDLKNIGLARHQKRITLHPGSLIVG